MYARQPLKVAELAEVLSVRDGDRGLNKEVMHENDILELCRGFIVVEPESTTLQITHKTGQTFLQEHHFDDISPKRLDIATTCLRYLQFDEFEKWEERDIEDWKANYKALDYIARYWGDHVKEVEGSDYVQTGVLGFLASKRKRTLIQKRRGWTIFHIIGYNGLGTICKLVLQAQQAETVNR
jgi:hypothetical protein